MVAVSDTAFAYVDANYVRVELEKAGESGNFNPRHLWPLLSFTTAKGTLIRADRLFFYDAVDANGPEEAQQARREYLQKVEELPFISVVTGFVRPGRKARRQQKGVDVNIAVDALEAASAGRTLAIILVAGDADFCPLADAIRRTGCFFFVCGYQSSLSLELRQSADVAQLLPSPREGHLKPF